MDDMIVIVITNLSTLIGTIFYCVIKQVGRDHKLAIEKFGKWASFCFFGAEWGALCVISWPYVLVVFNYLENK